MTKTASDSSRPPTSGAAVASLVLGIIGVFALCLTTIPAIIFGHVAVSRIRKSNGQLSGKGLAMTGLVLGYLLTMVGVVLPVLLVTNPSLVFATLEGKSVTEWHVEKFERRAGLVIPSTAKATDHRAVFSMDGMEFLKLEMPAYDLAGFLSKSGLDGELTNTTRTASFNSLFGDFLPAQPKKFREGQKSLSGGEFLNVLVDEDSPTTVVVYLCWFGT